MNDRDPFPLIVCVCVLIGIAAVVCGVASCNAAIDCEQRGGIYVRTAWSLSGYECVQPMRRP